MQSMFSKGSLRWPWKKDLVIPEDEDEYIQLLLEAIMKNQGKHLSDLLMGKPSFDVNSLVSERAKRTLIHHAASAGNLDCLVVLKKFGADLTAREFSGGSCLHICAKNGHKECMKWLTENGGDVHIKNNDGLTALHWLGSNGHVELIKYLIDHGAIIDDTDNLGQTPLHMACQNGHKDAVVYLLERNANFLRKDKLGRTPLHFACRYGQAECVKQLLKLNVEIEEAEGGDTALHFAVAGGFKDCVLLLVKHFPRLIHRIVALAGQENVDEGNIYKSLEFLCFQHDYAHEILTRLAEITAISGQLLLSPSADAEVIEPKFLSQIRILTRLTLQLIGKKLPNPSITFANRDKLKTTNIFVQVSPALNITSFDRPQISEPPQHPQSPSPPMPDPSEPGPSSRVPLDPIASTTSFSSASSSNANAGEPAGGERYLSPEPLGQPSSSSSDPPSPNLSSSSPSRSVSFSGRLTFSRRAATGKRKALEAEQEMSEEKKKGILKEVVSQFSACWAAMGEWLNLFEKQEAGEELDIYANRLPVLVHGYYLYTLLADPSPEHPPKTFLQFVDQNSPVLLFLVGRQPKAIFEQFHFLLEHEALLDRFMKTIRSQPFGERVNWFYQHLQSSNFDQTPTYEELNSFLMVSRSNVFEDACSRLGTISADQLKRNLNIRFNGEAGTGAGVRREWFDILSKEILNPDYALFLPSSDGCTVQPNGESYVNPDHLNFFRFAGRLIGLALYYHQLIDVHFTRSFYKHMLGIRVNYNDVASIDPSYHRSLQWILDNDITDAGMELTFEVEQDSFGTMKKVELKPNGSQIPVTEENKREYVQLATELKMTSGIMPQIKSFLEGFHELIPRPLIAMFNEYEIELLLCGVPEINVQDWKANTMYTDFSPEQPIMEWFWEIVESYSTQDRVLLLQFGTGSSRVPMGGFAALEGAEGPIKFTISRVNVPIDRLPTASTCFNLLKFPEYTSKEMLQERLRVAVFYGSKGFEFG